MMNIKEKTTDEQIYCNYKEDRDHKRKYINERLRKSNDLYKGKIELSNKSPTDSKKEEKEAKKHIKLITPNIVEIFTSTSRPIRVKMGEDQALNEILTKYANYEFTNRTKRATSINKIANTILREGTVFVESLWKKRVKHIKIKIPGMEESFWQEETIEDRPTFKIIDNFDIYPDKDAKTADEMGHCSIVEEGTLAKFKQDGFFSEEELEGLSEGIRSDEDRRVEIDEDDDIVTIVKYWGVHKMNEDDKYAVPMVAWMEESSGKVFKKELSPMARGNIPVYSAGYDEDGEGSIWKESIPELLEQDQTLVTQITKEIIEHLKASNNGQVFFETEGISNNQLKKMRNGEKFILVKKLNKMKQGQFNRIPGEIFGFMANTRTEMREATGASSSMPSLRKASLNKDSQEEQMTNGQQRLAVVVRFIGEMLSDVIRDNILMTAEFMDDTQLGDIIGEENIELFRTILDKKNVDIAVVVGTAENKAKEMFNMNMIMQQSKQLQQSVPPKIYNKLLVKQYELNEMYDDADELRNYEPPAPPSVENSEEMQQQLANLRLENAKLQGEIEEGKVRILTTQMRSQNDTRETDASVELKRAKVVTEKMTGQGKMIDNTFLPTEKKTALEKAQEGEVRQYGKF